MRARARARGIRTYQDLWARVRDQDLSGSMGEGEGSGPLIILNECEGERDQGLALVRGYAMRRHASGSLSLQYVVMLEHPYDHPA